MDWLILVTEIIGTVAFAASGAMTGIRKKMDLLGVAILGIITAVGGGILRDVMLGITPPAAFVTTRSLLLALATAVVVFVCWGRVPHHGTGFDRLLFWMDTVGLAVFTVLGLEAALAVRPDAQIVLLLFVAMLTGTGGGVLRDVLAGDRPYIFMKHIYATASLLGAAVYLLLHSRCRPEFTALAAMAVVIVIRCLSSHYKWNLPKAYGNKMEQKGSNKMSFTFNHFNFNVLDLEKSLAFYDQALGLKEVRRKVAEDGSFILVYLGDSVTDFTLELTWLRDRTEPYNLGDEEFHLCLKADDFAAAHEKHAQMGVICFENPAMGIYFIQDPDGYWIELIP